MESGPPGLPQRPRRSGALDAPRGNLRPSGPVPGRRHDVLTSAAAGPVPTGPGQGARSMTRSSLSRHRVQGCRRSHVRTGDGDGSGAFGSRSALAHRRSRARRSGGASALNCCCWPWLASRVGGRSASTSRTWPPAGVRHHPTSPAPGRRW
ncbi:hypothetical protein HBB16_13960 [Pseudonocardia sp. MCCB 268]|nr:hypothetical protein [Pseudonocardia cytotoxica]